MSQPTPREVVETKHADFAGKSVKLAASRLNLENIRKTRGATPEEVSDAAVAARAAEKEVVAAIEELVEAQMEVLRVTAAE